jgi:hypothetical protein
MAFNYLSKVLGSISISSAETWTADTNEKKSANAEAERRPECGGTAAGAAEQLA